MEHDFIRRSKLLAKKCMIRGHLDTGSPCPSKVRAVPVDVIEREPAVDAVPVRHGRWALNEDCQPFYNYCTADYYYNCSECNYTISSRYGLYNYCPNCGAKMDGGDEDG